MTSHLSTARWFLASAVFAFVVLSAWEAFA